ncbi:CaiB/BaiF CoA transferase family protein [Nocardia vaccinii]|uniref:CaiB/BaiF CoA transferase family protein n=1 Tax=Nocardia vaccinii TaxID=1822 RepID=UPI0008358FA7|nr:CoA transferase [Nocardia vaccinii]
MGRHEEKPVVGALSGLLICDFSGQIAGAGSTRVLAAFGAEVIRIEDPVRSGRWDILRGGPPYRDERRGIELGVAFNNHNVGKRAITLNLRTERGRELARKLALQSGVVTENFSAGVLDRLGLGYERLSQQRPDLIYVSHTGFGRSGPYASFHAWAPITQAMCGLTAMTRSPGRSAAGIGYSYMDYAAANYIVFALLSALWHREETGEGQLIDVAGMEVGAGLLGPEMLEASVNGRRFRDDEQFDVNRSQSQSMAPHRVYPCRDEDTWVAIACRHDLDWKALGAVIDEHWATEARFETLAGRLDHADELDTLLAMWTSRWERSALVDSLVPAGVPCTAVATPPERIEKHPHTSDWGLWPTVQHPEIGDIRVDGLPLHLSRTDWQIERSAPLIGEDNDYVFGQILGLSKDEIISLREESVI